MSTSSGHKPQRIAQYLLIEQIGAGAMGVVWRAHDERLDRDVALKVIATAAQGDADMRRRFRTEAMALTRLNHPNIATVFDFATEVMADGVERDYVVMELIPGNTLDERLGRKPAEREQFISLGTQLLKGISAAHDAGVLHRDLKPTNVRITPEGHLKILDFGLAKMIAPVQEDTVTASMSAPGTIVGTVPYMSPEQLRGEVVDARTDIYAAGAVMYEMATGRRAFEGAGTELMNSVLNDLPSVPSAVNRKLDAATDAILLKALEKRRELRYQSAREMLVDIERLKSLPAGSLRAAKAGDARRFKWRIAAAAVMLIAAVVALILVARNRNVANRPANEIKTLAVLPLKPIGPEAAKEYLGLGLSDSIINKLSRTHLFVVRPFSAVRRFSSEESDSLSAAKELGVDAVLDGTVQKSGSKLRVSANLLQASDGSSLWADTFDVQSEDVFSVQEQLATQVVERLRGSLKGEVKKEISKRYTSNPEAYANFVKGNYFLNQATTGPEARNTTVKAEDYFRKAIELDPNYALARAALANVYLFNALFVDLDPKWVEKANAELAVAEKLDANIPNIYAVRGEILWSRFSNFDLLGAEREFRKAQALDPGENSAETGMFYSHFGFAHLTDAAVERAEQFSPEEALGYKLEAYWLLGRYQQVVEACTAALHTPCPSASLLRLGRLKEAEALLSEKNPQNESNPQVLATKALLLSAQGKQPAAEKAIEGVLRAARQNRGFHHVAFDAACIYAQGGKVTQATEMLRQAAEAGMPNLPAFRNDPFLKPLQGDIKYERFMAELKVKWDAYETAFENSLP